MSAPEFHPADRTPDGDDVLDVGRPRRFSNELVGLLVVLAVVVAAGVWLASRGSSSGKPAAATSSSTHAPTHPTITSAPRAHERYLVNCPGAAYCSTSRAVPRHMLVVVRHYFPAAVPVSAYTVVRAGPAPSQLWYRGLNTDWRGFQVLVVVSSRGSFLVDTRDSVASSPDSTIGSVATRVGGFTVQVQMTGPPHWRPPMRAVRALAHDPRLTSLP